MGGAVFWDVFSYNVGSLGETGVADRRWRYRVMIGTRLGSALGSTPGVAPALEKHDYSMTMLTLRILVSVSEMKASHTKRDIEAVINSLYYAVKRANYSLVNALKCPAIQNTALQTNGGATKGYGYRRWTLGCRLAGSDTAGSMVPLKLEDDVQSVDDTLCVVSGCRGGSAREDSRECNRGRSAGC
jgi:hypothetical protein